MVKKFLILITDGEAQDDVRDPAKLFGTKVWSSSPWGVRGQQDAAGGDQWGWQPDLPRRELR